MTEGISLEKTIKQYLSSEAIEICERVMSKEEAVGNLVMFGWNYESAYYLTVEGMCRDFAAKINEMIACGYIMKQSISQGYPRYVVIKSPLRVGNRFCFIYVESVYTAEYLIQNMRWLKPPPNARLN